MIFFDIDGTLLTEEKELLASTKEAINELKKAGHKLAIATGRAPFMFKELREELEIDTYVSFNGQYVVAEGNVIYDNPLNENDLKLFAQFAQKNNHGLVYMDHEQMKSTTEYDPLIEESIGTLKFKHPEHDPSYSTGRNIYQTLLFCKEDSELEYIQAFGGFTFVRWHNYSTDVLPAGGSKAIGIQKVIDHYKVAKENVYAFGDGLNDIEMLSFVGHGIAMGNAHDKAKQVAKHVTKHVAEDGIVHGLRLVGLLK